MSAAQYIKARAEMEAALESARNAFATLGPTDSVNYWAQIKLRKAIENLGDGIRALTDDDAKTRQFQNLDRQ